MEETKETLSITPHKPPDSSSKPRRFLPQPIEESNWSSRKQRQGNEIDGGVGKENRLSGKPDHHGAADHIADVKQAPRRRFAPEAVEISSKSSRRRPIPAPVETSTRSSKDRPKEADADHEAPKPRGKFLPQPVETTTNVRRRRPPSPEDDSGSSRSSSPVSRSSSGSSRRFKPELISTDKGSYRRAILSPAERKAAAPMWTT